MSHISVPIIDVNPENKATISAAADSRCTMQWLSDGSVMLSSEKISAGAIMLLTDENQKYLELTSDGAFILHDTPKQVALLLYKMLWNFCNSSTSKVHFSGTVVLAVGEHRLVVDGPGDMTWTGDQEGISQLTPFFESLKKLEIMR